MGGFLIVKVLEKIITDNKINDISFNNVILLMPLLSNSNQLVNMLNNFLPDHIVDHIHMFKLFTITQSKLVNDKSFIDDIINVNSYNIIKLKQVFQTYRYLRNLDNNKLINIFESFENIKFTIIYAIDEQLNFIETKKLNLLNDSDNVVVDVCLSKHEPAAKNKNSF